jgi:hypothetical protein
MFSSMDIRKPIIERIMKGGLVSMEVESPNPDLRCFVGVIPLTDNDGQQRFSMRHFCIEKRYIEMDWDIHPEELRFSRRVVVENLLEAEDIIRQWGADPGSLDYPWNNDYPL